MANTTRPASVNIRKSDGLDSTIVGQVAPDRQIRAACPVSFFEPSWCRLLDADGRPGEGWVSRELFRKVDGRCESTIVAFHILNVDGARPSMVPLDVAASGVAVRATEIAFAHLSIGKWRFTERRLVEAQHHLRSAIAGYERLASQESDKQGSLDRLGTAWLLVGNMARSAGDMGGALANYRRALSIWQSAGPLVTERARYTAHAQHAIGSVLQATGDLAGAETAFGSGLRLLGPLHTANPGSVEIIKDMVAFHTHLAQVRRGRGDVKAAIEDYRRAIDFAAKSAGDGDSEAMARLRLAQLLEATGAGADARGEYERARTLIAAAMATTQDEEFYRPILQWVDRQLARLSSFFMQRSR